MTFDRADRNNDGAVTRWEFANSGSATATPAEMSFDDMDHNNDGVISRYEWHADRATFDRMDRNQDGDRHLHASSRARWPSTRAPAASRSWTATATA